MEDFSLQTGSPAIRLIAPVIAAVALAGVSAGYAVHEHHAAQAVAAQNAQQRAQLEADQKQLSDLTSRVNALAAPPAPATQEAQSPQPEQQATAASAPAPASAHPAKPRAGHVLDKRYSKLQTQPDAQSRQIAQTRGDLQNTRTELTGSIAHTHSELVVLERRGERSYFEFDLNKSKHFRREGPVGVSLHKANVKHQYADLQLMVDDRNLSQKHVNLDQPVKFFDRDTEQPIQIVINSITKDHIHGYVSAPRYRKSELSALADANASGGMQPPARKKLTVAQQDAPQP